MSKRKGETTVGTDFYIPDDIWSAIASTMPWYDVKTLLRFISVSKQAIRFVLPCIKELCNQLCKTGEARHPLAKAFDLYMSPRLSHRLLGKRIHNSLAFCVSEAYVCMGHFFRLEESALTLEEWRKYGSFILSMVRLAMLREKYSMQKKISNGVARTTFRVREQIPSDRLSKLFYCPSGLPYLAQRIKKVANLRVVNGMATNTPQLTVDAKRWLTTSIHTERERNIYSLALANARGNNKRAICYYVMAETYKVTKPTPHAQFKDIVLLNTKEEAVHVYTLDSPMISKFVDRCVYYDGTTKEVRRALKIEYNIQAYKDLCARRCKEMKSVFLDKAPVNSKVWEHESSASNTNVHFSLSSSSESVGDYENDSQEEEEEEEEFIMALPGSQ